MERIVGTVKELSLQKCSSHWKSTDFEIWIEYSVFAIQEIEKVFLKCRLKKKLSQVLYIGVQVSESSLFAKVCI